LSGQKASESIWAQRAASGSSGPAFFRPSGPTVVLQAQRAGTMNAGGRSPPVAESPNSSSGPSGRQCHGFCLALTIWRRLLCQPFGLFPSEGADEPWLDEPRQPLYRPSGPKQPKTVNPPYLSGQKASESIWAQRAASGSSGPAGRHNGCRGTKSPGAGRFFARWFPSLSPPLKQDFPYYR
jgi:hypothetical protein